MKTVSINIYKFNELSEESKQKALDHLFDLNVDYNWWEDMYEDAKEIGLKITSSDTERKDITGEFNLSACEVAQNILNNHGETCETYKTASNFLDEWNPIFADYMNESSENYESSDSESKMIDLETDFLNSLLQDYLIMLEHDYDYRTSSEAIIESIEANDYDFTEDGELY
jgi:hypothetical protein